MRAKSLQLYPTLFDTMDHSLPGSSVHGIIQARILECVAMPSSNSSLLYWSKQSEVLTRVQGVKREILCPDRGVTGSHHETHTPGKHCGSSLWKTQSTMNRNSKVMALSLECTSLSDDCLSVYYIPVDNQQLISLEQSKFSKALSPCRNGKQLTAGSGEKG